MTEPDAPRAPSSTGGGRPLFVLVGGGARSGKSRFALARAAALGPRRLFIATAEGNDDEMRARLWAVIQPEDTNNDPFQLRWNLDIADTPAIVS